MLVKTPGTEGPYRVVSMEAMKSTALGLQCPPLFNNQFPDIKYFAMTHSCREIETYLQYVYFAWVCMTGRIMPPPCPKILQSPVGWVYTYTEEGNAADMIELQICDEEMMDHPGGPSVIT